MDQTLNVKLSEKFLHALAYLLTLELHQIADLNAQSTRNVPAIKPVSEKSVAIHAPVLADSMLNVL